MSEGKVDAGDEESKTVERFVGLRQRVLPPGDSNALPTPLMPSRSLSRAPLFLANDYADVDS